MKRTLILTPLLLWATWAMAWNPAAFKKPTDQELSRRLSDIQYKVTQEEGTEPPYKNEYWDNHKPGVYVDVVSGEPLFSSLDKFESGTGWPSFTKPLVPGNIVTRVDRHLVFSVRTEVRSKHANSHLGHVFDDGPAPTGLRYCMNSASLRFVPAEELEKRGYGEFAGLFPERLETATFAGGCFWCMQPPYDTLKGRGVISTTVGYTGGAKDHPTYDEVSDGKTGHIESIQITFDSKKITYQELLDLFWVSIDPYDASGQFCDKGKQYTSAIFYESEDQRRSAETSKTRLAKSGRLVHPIVTEIRPAMKFYPAEDYHQDYYKKNPIRYKFYRLNCGRDQRLREVWGKSAH